MRSLGRGLLLGLLGLLSTFSPARAETSAGLNERLRKATAVLSELASGKQDTKSLHDAANTDGTFKAEIFSYARSTGFFAGASFEGATVQPDSSAIRTMYGAKADSRDVLLGTRYAVPAAGRQFVNVLTSYSPTPKKR